MVRVGRNELEHSVLHGEIRGSFFRRVHQNTLQDRCDQGNMRPRVNPLKAFKKSLARSCVREDLYLELICIAGMSWVKICVQNGYSVHSHNKINVA
jgi:hypothetical protein